MVATHGHFLCGNSRLKSTALAKKSRRSSMNRAPRFTASSSSICTILWRVRPMITQTRSTPRDMDRLRGQPDVTWSNVVAAACGRKRTRRDLRQLPLPEPLPFELPAPQGREPPGQEEVQDDPAE